MSKKGKFILLFIVVISFLYFAERYVERANEEYPEVNSSHREVSEEFGVDFFPESSSNQVIHHAYFSLSYNESFEQAEWVAYELKSSHLSYNEFERPYFVEDREVSSGSADWRNYKNSGYDRGHLCPAGDRRFSYQAYLETFLTSNISPMDKEFNRGVWNDLEKQVRRWAKAKDGVFVITGGVLKKGLKTIGSERVGVPQAFYKIVVDASNGTLESIAFLIPNKAATDSYKEYTTSIDSIEAITGIDFFANLNEEEASRLESSVQTTPWF